LSSNETTLLSVGLDGKMTEWSMHRPAQVVRSLTVPYSSSFQTNPLRSVCLFVCLSVWLSVSLSVSFSVPRSALSFFSLCDFLYVFRLLIDVSSFSFFFPSDVKWSWMKILIICYYLLLILPMMLTCSVLLLLLHLFKLSLAMSVLFWLLTGIARYQG
jgi:hypothetical protein